MSTTRDDIRRWLELGKKKGSTHLIVVCDTWDWEDFPVYVEPNEDVHKIEKEHSGQNMQKIMEVYNISKDWETQIKEGRSFNY